MRLGLIHISQETCDFNPVPTTRRDFAAFGIHEGAEIAEKVGKIGQIGGHYAAVAASGRAIETVPIFRSWSCAGGRITREAFDFFADRIRTGLQRARRL